MGEQDFLSLILEPGKSYKTGNGDKVVISKTIWPLNLAIGFFPEKLLKNKEIMWGAWELERKPYSNCFCFVKLIPIKIFNSARTGNNSDDFKHRIIGKWK